MLEYQEIMKIKNKYEYNKEHKVIDKETGKEIKDVEKIQKIKSAYLMLYMLHKKEKEEGVKYKSKEEANNSRIKYVNDVNDKLASGIIDGTKTGKVDLNLSDISEALSSASKNYGDLIKAFVNNALKEYKIEFNEVTYKSPTEEEKSEMSGGSIQLNGLNTTRYKMKQEHIVNKEKYIKELLHAYDMVETEKHYEERKIKEEKNVSDVMKAIKNGKLENIDNLKNYQFVELLKAADSITLNTGRDILKEFSNIPEVNDRLKKYKENKVIEILNKKAKRNSPLPKTPIEEEKQLANELLAEQGNVSKLLTLDRITVNKCKEFKAIFKNKEEAQMEWSTKRIIARQEGKIPGKIQEFKGKNGVSYKMQVDESRERD